MTDRPVHPDGATGGASMDPAEHAKYLEALTYAVTLHTELRKGGRGVPYLAHLLDASSTVWEDGGSLEAAMAALLHDSVEDKGETRSDLARRFGPTVAEIVIGCTDSGEAPSDQKPPFFGRKATHLDRLRERAHRQRSGTGSAIDLGVLQVTAADKCSNLRSILDDVEQQGPEYLRHFKGGCFLTTWYYETVIDVLATAFPATDRAPSSSRVVCALVRELPRLQQVRDDALAEIRPAAERIAAVLGSGQTRVGRIDSPSLAPGAEVELVAREAANRLHRPDRGASDGESIRPTRVCPDPSTAAIRSAAGRI
ncbi:MAG: HD domain-containing protein, partial [Actinomycetota bacterium]